MSSEAQKKAYRNYIDKVKPIQFAVQYKTDKNEGLRIKQYLADNGLTANAYIKELIKNDLDTKDIPYPCTDNEQGNV